MDPNKNDNFQHMENKLESVWSTELDEYLDAYFDEVYGIDIGDIICDEILKTDNAI